jgi:hypothetical protein
MVRLKVHCRVCDRQRDHGVHDQSQDSARHVLSSPRFAIGLVCGVVHAIQVHEDVSELEDKQNVQDFAFFGSCLPRASAIAQGQR